MGYFSCRFSCGCGAMNQCGCSLDLNPGLVRDASPQDRCRMLQGGIPQMTRY
ncbi:MAG: hypothetical protein CM15mP103_02520 [Gammaproteobacteria bacterium]|nr:MAG: hypothetical protein CM15mP103_02520 [Gammaproteobacteria bacterium]